MARTTLTVTSINSPYDGSLNTPTYEAADVSNGNQFQITGDEMIVARNTDTSGSNHKVVLKSVDDKFNRQEDVTQTVSGQTSVCLGPMDREGWENSSGNMDVSASSATIAFSIWRLSI